ncbi:MAG: HEAT repeat domain-containing protein [Gemmatimonadales bacterium]|nr:HEAT repeat domain-containing protein [Gemmatimonadales bacterium]
MTSPYPVASLLGALLFVVRHEPGGAEHQRALLDALRQLRHGRPLAIVAETDALLLDEAMVALDAPGATFLTEQMLLQGIRSLELPDDMGDEDMLRLFRVLAAFPGTYASFAEVLAALGPTVERIQLTRVASDFEVFRALPWRGRSPIEFDAEASIRSPGLPGIRHGDLDDLERAESVHLDGGTPGTADGAGALSGGAAGRSRPPLDLLIRRGREAIEREDWGGLLEAALDIVDAESEAPSDLAGSAYRIELKRLMPRKHLAMIAKLAHGERKQEAVTVLRRFGADSTEILMNFLVEAMSIGERRGYYSAITQMNEGTDAIVRHLSHGTWYVVRNAADLCGELALADAVPELAKQAHHEDERVRKSVAEALGKIGTPAAMDGLRRTLVDPSPSVRIQSVAHLSGRGARGMARPIGERLREEQDPQVQQEALSALGRIGSPEAIELLTEWAAPGGKLLGRRPVGVRLAAVKALAGAGAAAFDTLARLARDETPEIRAAVAAALGAMRP